MNEPYGLNRKVSLEDRLKESRLYYTEWLKEEAEYHHRNEMFEEFFEMSGLDPETTTIGDILKYCKENKEK